MESRQELLSQAAQVLAGMSSRLLQLSAELPQLDSSSSALVKELLDDIQTVRESIRIGLERAGTSHEELTALRRELDRHRMLLNVAELFYATLDIDDVASRILDSVLEWVGAERGVLLLQDPTTGEHLVKVGRELTESTYHSSEVALPRTVVAQVLKERKPVFSTDVHGDPALISMASVRDLNIRSLACLPLILGTDVLGVIYLDYQAAQRKLGPDDQKTLEDVCRHAAQSLSNANRYRKAREWARKCGQTSVGRLIGTSPIMRGIFELINQVALSPTTSVLISGASGTGKELVAHAIHDLGARAEEPFVAVNCAALPPTLLESELFGHEKGAFTDAKTRRQGLFEQADGGTLFLDEVAEMSISLQSKLLRVLEERTVRRLGGTTDIPVDVRVIAATNKDIGRVVEAGELREDLYYRLNVFPIVLPPLSERGDDVILIANSFIDDLNSRLGTRVEPIDPSSALASALRGYHWPGNVRELRNVLERAMILARGRELRVSDFPSPIGTIDVTKNVPQSQGAKDHPRPTEVPAPQTGATKSLASLEEDHIDRVMTQCGGDKRRAAEILGIDLSTLYRKLERRKGKSG